MSKFFEKGPKEQSHNLIIINNNMTTTECTILHRNNPKKAFMKPMKKKSGIFISEKLEKKILMIHILYTN